MDFKIEDLEASPEFKDGDGEMVGPIARNPARIEGKAEADRTIISSIVWKSTSFWNRDTKKMVV